MLSKMKGEKLPQLYSSDRISWKEVGQDDVAQCPPNSSAICKATMIMFYSAKCHWITKKICVIWIKIFSKEKGAAGAAGVKPMTSSSWPGGLATAQPRCGEWQDHPSFMAFIEKGRRVLLKEERSNPSNNPLRSQNYQKVILIHQRVSILLPKIKNPPDMDSGKQKISVLMCKSHVL